MEEDKGGVITKIGKKLSETWARTAVTVGATALGVLTYITPVNAETLYDYRMSDSYAENYIEENISDYGKRGVFRTFHELLKQDSEAERTLEERDIRHYLGEWEDLIDRHGDYDGVAEPDEIEESSEEIREMENFLADFWLGDGDGFPEHWEISRYEEAVEQHESLVASKRIREQDGEYWSEAIKDTDMYRYADQVFDEEHSKIIFFETGKLIERYRNCSLEDQELREELGKVYCSLEKLADLTDGERLDMGEDPVGEEEYTELAREVQGMMDEIIDYHAGDGDKVKEAWETRKFKREYMDENVAVIAMKKLVQRYGY